MKLIEYVYQNYRQIFNIKIKFLININLKSLQKKSNNRKISTSYLLKIWSILLMVHHFYHLKNNNKMLNLFHHLSKINVNVNYVQKTITWIVKHLCWSVIINIIVVENAWIRLSWSESNVLFVEKLFNQIKLSKIESYPNL